MLHFTVYFKQILDDTTISNNSIKPCQSQLSDINNEMTINEKCNGISLSVYCLATYDYHKLMLSNNTIHDT